MPTATCFIFARARVCVCVCVCTVCFIDQINFRKKPAAHIPEFFSIPVQKPSREVKTHPQTYKEPDWVCLRILVFTCADVSKDVRPELRDILQTSKTKSPLHFSFHISNNAISNHTHTHTHTHPSKSKTGLLQWAFFLFFFLIVKQVCTCARARVCVLFVL